MILDNKFKIGQQVKVKKDNTIFTVLWIKISETEPDKVFYSEEKDGKYFSEEELLLSD